MTWFKVDDNLAFHPKTVAAGNAALGLWVRAGSWSAHTHTDGIIPNEIASTIGTRNQIGRLVSSGFWIPKGNGFEFHEWHERQPIAADLKAASEKQGHSGTYGNHKRWHASKGIRNPDCPHCQGDDDA
jgi:hypothetical protein